MAVATAAFVFVAGFTFALTLVHIAEQLPLYRLAERENGEAVERRYKARLDDVAGQV